MEQQPKAPKAGMRGWVKALLAVSLAVNLLVVGLIVGVGANRYRDGDRRHPPGNELMEFGPFTRALPPASRGRIKTAFRERVPELRASRAEMRKSFTALDQALRAVPYDQAAVVAALDIQKSQIDGHIRLMRVLFLEEVAAMSDGERVELADNLKRAVRRGPPKGAPQH